MSKFRFQEFHGNEPSRVEVDSIVRFFLRCYKKEDHDGYKFDTLIFFVNNRIIHEHLYYCKV